MDLGYLLRGKYVVEKSVLSTLLNLNEQKWVLSPPASPDSRGTGLSIDHVRTNRAAHTACTRYAVHLCTALCIFENGSMQSEICFVLLKPVEISHDICLAFYLLFEATNLGKRQRSAIVPL